MFSSACLNLRIGMRMHNIGRCVKMRSIAGGGTTSRRMLRSQINVFVGSGQHAKSFSSAGGRTAREAWMVI